MNFEGCTPQAVCNHPEGCSRDAALKGMCRTHYHREWERTRKNKRQASRKAWADKNPQAVATMLRRSRRRSNEKTWAPIKAYKESIGCAKCGFNRDGRVLAFHHKDPSTKDKKFRNYSIQFTLKPRRTMAEIEKCILLCHNCHAEEHARSFPPTMVGKNRHERTNARRKWITGEAFRAHKEAIGCNRCGYQRCGGALAFHHVDPSTKDQTVHIDGEGWFYRWSKVLTEIEKCLLVCKNCHSELHLEGRRDI